MNDEIPTGVEPGTLEYWKARSRQWQKRCVRSEHEKTELIAELNALKTANAKLRADKRTHLSALRAGDVQPTTRDFTPRPL